LWYRVVHVVDGSNWLSDNDWSCCHYLDVETWGSL